MPIYVYVCNACGIKKEILQKINDAPLTECPSCHQHAFTKQLTAAAFQLKGNGWYATDFKNGSPNTNQTKPDSTPSTPATTETGDSPVAN